MNILLHGDTSRLTHMRLRKEQHDQQLVHQCEDPMHVPHPSCNQHQVTRCIGHWKTPITGVSDTEKTQRLHELLDGLILESYSAHDRTGSR